MLKRYWQPALQVHLFVCYPNRTHCTLPVYTTGRLCLVTNSWQTLSFHTIKLNVIECLHYVPTLSQATSFNAYTNHLMETSLSRMTGENPDLEKWSCRKLVIAVSAAGCKPGAPSSPSWSDRFEDVWSWWKIDSQHSCDISPKMGSWKIVSVLNYSLYLLMKIITPKMASCTKIL